MEHFLNLYRILLADSAKFQEKEGNNQLAKTFRSSQEKLRNLLNLRNNCKPVVAFVGLTNVGKSTLLSALFGAKVAPSRNRPWSSVPVEYRYSDKYEVQAEFSDSIDSVVNTFESADDMLKMIEEYATEKGRECARILYAMMPSELLQNGLVIADTPGFGAATAAGGDNHGDRLREYLPHADYIFWVIKSLQGITRSELDFYDRFLRGRCENIIVNCYDQYSPEERNEFIAVNGNPLDARFNWHFIDAQSALRGKCTNNDSLQKSSGIGDFEELILSLNPTEGRFDYLEGCLVEFFEKIKRFRGTRKERLFFAEHRRLQLMHEIAKYNDDAAVLKALKESIL